MAAAFRVGANNKGTSLAPTVTLAAPAATGDVVLVQFTQNNTNVVTATPAGLTQLDLNVAAAAFPNIYYYGVIGQNGLALGALNWTLSASRQWTVAVYVASGIDTASPIVGSLVVASTVATQSTMVAPNITPTANAWLVECAAGKSNGTTILSWTVSAGWTIRSTAAGANTFSGTATFADRDAGLATSGTTYGGETYTPSAASGASVRYIIALRPASTNAAPVVNAGADISVDPNLVDTFTLTATASDSDGSIASYLWEDITSGTTTVAGSGASRTIAVPRFAYSMTKTYRVTVTDNLGATTSDTVVVTVLPHTRWRKIAGSVIPLRRASVTVVATPMLTKVQSATSGVPTGGSASVTLAGTPAAGNLLLFFVGYHASYKITPPAGTVLVAGPSTSTNAAAAIFVRHAKSTDSKTWAVTTTGDNVSITVVEYAAASGYVPQVNAGPVLTNAAVNTTTTPTVSSDANGMAVAFLSVNENIAATPSLTSGWTYISDNHGNYHSMFVAQRTALTADGTQTGATFGYVTTTEGVAWTVQINAVSMLLSINSVEFGDLITDTTHYSTEATDGILDAMIELDWSQWNTADGVFSASYESAVSAKFNNFRAAGMRVTLGLGNHYFPAWVTALPNAKYVDNHGVAYNAPNLVFSNTVRSKLSAYLARIDVVLGLQNMYALRINNMAELYYPGTGSYMAFDVNAQGGSDRPSTLAACPFPGWHPGTLSNNGYTLTTTQVNQWAMWYVGGLVDYAQWLMTQAASFGFAGKYQILTPGSGARPDTWTATVNAALPDHGTVGIAAAWDKVYSLFTNTTNVQVYDSGMGDQAGTPVDNVPLAEDGGYSLTNTALNSWSAHRWLSRVAYEYGLGISGENVGYGGTTTGLDAYYLDKTASGMLQHAFSLLYNTNVAYPGKFTDFYWAHDYRLYDGTIPYALYKGCVQALSLAAVASPLMSSTSLMSSPTLLSRG